MTAVARFRAVSPPHPLLRFINNTHYRNHPDMSSGDNDLTDRILEGTAYDQATATVNRTFPFSIGRKIRIASGILAASALLAPALYISRGRIRSIEGVENLAGVFGLRIATLALLGVITSASAGLVLIRQHAVVRRGSLDEERAQRLVRVEDVLMWFVIQGGAFVLIAVGLAVVGTVSAEAIDTLYQSGVMVYQTSGLVDARAVSALGGAFAVVLYALSRIGEWY